MAKIELISEKWLIGKRSELDMTRPGERREELIVELANAERHFAAKNEVIDLAGAKGFRRNQYDGQCALTGEKVKAFCGFCRKGDNGRWQTLSWESVVEILNYQFEE